MEGGKEEKVKEWMGAEGRGEEERKEKRSIEKKNG